MTDDARVESATAVSRLHHHLRAAGVYSAAACSALAVSMTAARVGFTGSRMYLFLVWNLFLAWVPIVAALAFARVPEGRRGWPLLAASGAFWLVFFPNAPYLVTDLLHLGESPLAPKWFDAAMLFVYAWTGCVAGFTSLALVHTRVRSIVSRFWARAFVVAVAALTGFGVYLGRFERWNSWDVLSEPGGIVRDILAIALHPAAHPRAYGFTALFAAFLLAGYATFLSRRPVQ